MLSGASVVPLQRVLRDATFDEIRKIASSVPLCHTRAGTPITQRPDQAPLLLGESITERTVLSGASVVPLQRVLRDATFDEIRKIASSVPLCHGRSFLNVFADRRERPHLGRCVHHGRTCPRPARPYAADGPADAALASPAAPRRRVGRVRVRPVAAIAATACRAGRSTARCAMAMYWCCASSHVLILPFVVVISSTLLVHILLSSSRARGTSGGGELDHDIRVPLQLSRLLPRHKFRRTQAIAGYYPRMQTLDFILDHFDKGGAILRVDALLCELFNCF